MTFNTQNIPDSEMPNILSVYWQMMKELESRIDPEKDSIDKHLVNGAYKVLNRSGICNHRPIWENK